MFSPYYAHARRKNKGLASPYDHVNVNVCLYGPNRRRWCMTERGAGALTQTEERLTIGPSNVHWADGKLTVEIDEWAVPAPRRVRGRVVVETPAITSECFTLDPNQRHRWWPAAPVSRVHVDLSAPELKWSGEGYLDSNEGDEPLEKGFTVWTWSRMHLADGSAALLYEPTFPDGRQSPLGLKIGKDASIERFVPPPEVKLKTTLWQVPRVTRSDDQASVLSTLEDTPFYARSSIQSRILGEEVDGVHESLDLRRFANPMIQMLLPFRMPRRA